MGKIIFFALVLAMIGCREDNRERVVDLEKRMAQLEKRQVMLERKLMMLPPQGFVRRHHDGEEPNPVPARQIDKPSKTQIAERERLRQEVKQKIEARNAELREEKARRKQKLTDDK